MIQCAPGPFIAKFLSLLLGCGTVDTADEASDSGKQIYLRCTGRGRKRRQVTRTGIVKEIDSRDPQRVKTDTCSRKFRKVLEICQRRSTSMISNDTESQSEYSISQYY